MVIQNHNKKLDFYKTFNLDDKNMTEDMIDAIKNDPLDFYSRQFNNNEENFLEASDSFDKLYEREFEKAFDIEHHTNNETVHNDGYAVCFFSPIIVSSSCKLPDIQTFPKSYFVLHFDKLMKNREFFIELNPHKKDRTASLICKTSEDPEYYNSEIIMIRDSFKVNASIAPDTKTDKPSKNNKYC